MYDIFYIQKRIETGIYGLFVMYLLYVTFYQREKKWNKKTFSMLYIYPSLLYLEVFWEGYSFIHTFFFFFLLDHQYSYFVNCFFCWVFIPCVIMEKKNIFIIFFFSFDIFFHSKKKYVSFGN